MSMARERRRGRFAVHHMWGPFVGEKLFHRVKKKKKEKSCFRKGKRKEKLEHTISFRVSSPLSFLQK
jgi:hypothetical protein